MGFKLVVLWTDVALWLLFAAIGFYAWRVWHHPTLRSSWHKVMRDAPALCSSLLLALCVGVTLADSVHFRRVLPASAGAPLLRFSRRLRLHSWGVV